VGDGPEKVRLQVLAEELGIVRRVKFWNKLSRKETLQKLGECTALIHPSLHESGGLVCLEAMAAGIPTICLDLGGPATQVTDDTGIKVQANTPEQVIHDLKKAIEHLAKDVELRMHMGKAGQKRVCEIYDWQIKSQILAQLYEEITKFNSI
jgi:glycosyltransferase involved in cell wall biosynthesis